MSFFNKKAKLTAQFILGCISILSGIILLFFGIFMQPIGVISTSVIVSFCELGGLGGALIGIDYKYKFKEFETEERYRYLDRKHCIDRKKFENKKEEED